MLFLRIQIVCRRWTCNNTILYIYIYEQQTKWKPVKVSTQLSFIRGDNRFFIFVEGGEQERVHTTCQSQHHIYPNV